MSEIPDFMNTKYDAIICAYASPYMKYNAYLEVLNNNPQAKMFWLVNDHAEEATALIYKLDNDYNEYQRLLTIQQSNVEKIRKEREDVLVSISSITKQ